MADVTKFIEADDATYFQYASESANPTLKHTFVELVKNNNSVLGSLATSLWQPGTQTVLNQVLYSPNMSPGLVAIVTQIGVTGTTEPTWGAEGGTVTDGGTTYVMAKKSAGPAMSNSEIDEVIV